MLTVAGQAFRQAVRVSTARVPPNEWEFEVGADATVAVKKGDVMLPAVWVRALKGQPERGEGRTVLDFQRAGGANVAFRLGGLVQTVEDPRLRRGIRPRQAPPDGGPLPGRGAERAPAEGRDFQARYLRDFLDLVRRAWWTNAAGRTDGDGTFRTRGFYGDYAVTANGKTVKARLAKGGGTVVVRL